MTGDRWARVVAVDHVDGEVRHRGRNAIVILLGNVAFGMAATVALFRVDGAASAGICLGVTLLSVPALLLVRRGHVDAGAGLFLSMILLGNVVSPLLVGGTRMTPVYLAIPAALAAVLLRPRFAVLVIAASLALAMAIPLYAPGPGATITTADVLVSAAILIVAVSVSTALGMWGGARALEGAERERRRAEVYAGELSRLNAELEQRVEERTESLSRALDRQEQLTADLAVRAPVADAPDGRALQAELERAAAVSHRTSRPWAAVVVVDDPDRPDPPPGDAVDHLADLVARTVRPGDLVARADASTVVVVARDTDADEAAGLAGAVRSVLAEIRRAGDVEVGSAGSAGAASSAEWPRRVAPHVVLERARARARGPSQASHPVASTR